MHVKTKPVGLDRRQALGLLGSLAATLVAACGSGSSNTGGGGSTGSGGAGTGGATGTGGGSAAVPWATGGTAAMKDKASYPNPFAGSTQTTCPLTCEMTLGPCYDSKSEELQDISYGYDGLPMRMYFQVLDDACKPVSGAVVDVWHVSAVGKYSGDDSPTENVAFCTGSDAEFTSHLYFRGKQTTGDDGVVFFDTCFPGWYSSRTVHVHLTISVGGQAYVTSQLFFPDALDDEIIGTQPIYKDRGPRDTTNTTDTVISESALPDYLFEYEKMSDGVMLAWKTLVIRSSLATASCAAPGGSGGGMGGPDGGPPPGFDGGPPGP